jgi:hypothetical protein
MPSAKNPIVTITKITSNMNAAPKSEFDECPSRCKPHATPRQGIDRPYAAETYGGGAWQSARLNLHIAKHTRIRAANRKAYA